MTTEADIAHAARLFIEARRAKLNLRETLRIKRRAQIDVTHDERELARSTEAYRNAMRQLERNVCREGRTVVRARRSRDPRWMQQVRALRDEGLSCHAIADRVLCSVSTVYYALHPEKAAVRAARARGEIAS